MPLWPRRSAVTLPNARARRLPLPKLLRKGSVTGILPLGQNAFPTTRVHDDRILRYRCRLMLD
jgi:hypothetical protein